MKLYFRTLLAMCALMRLHAKQYTACELANELVNVHGFERDKMSDWICLVKYESSFKTKAINRNYDKETGALKSSDHGLFQINDGYWYEPGPKNGCNINCNKLRDNYIEGDAKCARLICERHGFESWHAWTRECKGTSRGQQLLENCDF